MARVIAEYRTTIYDDGTMVSVRVPLTEETIKGETDFKPDIIDLGNTSARIGQTLAVLSYSRKLSKDKNYSLIDENISKAIRELAKMYGFEMQSIHDKITRQLKITMTQFRYYTRKFIMDNEFKELKELLIEKIDKKNKSTADLLAIKLFFDDPDICIILADANRTVI
ncbi:hypothetical protein [Hungatella hathewayi]